MKGVPLEYTRVWGIQVGRWDGKVSGLLNTEGDDNATATTEGLTAGSYALESNMDTRDEEDFAAENLPRKPNGQILYNEKGKSYKDEHADITKQTGRSEAGCVVHPEKYLPKPGTTRLPSNTGTANAANENICLSLVRRARPRVCPSPPFPLIQLPTNL